MVSSRFPRRLSRDHEVAREITYAHSAASRGGKFLVRATENFTGRLGLIQRARGYDVDVAAGGDFWEILARRYGVKLDVREGSLDAIPQSGPLIVVANHPFGILDGMMMGYILSRVRRGDFRILANSVFHKAEDIQRIVLPISFDQTKEAMRINLETRKHSLEYLAQGGAVGVFPGGTVSTSARPFGRPLDPAWRSFTAKMVAKSGATVLPIYFEGTNSRLFQVASHLHPNLRMALLINEFRRRVDSAVGVRIGAPLPQSELDARAKDPRAMMVYLRAQTYALGDPSVGETLGYEFENNHKTAEQLIERRVY